MWNFAFGFCFFFPFSHSDVIYSDANVVRLLHVPPVRRQLHFICATYTLAPFPRDDGKLAHTGND